MNNNYKLICNECKKTQFSDKPFSSDLKEDNKRYFLCVNCKKKIFFQFKIKDKKEEKIPIFIKTINIKSR